MSFDLGRVLNIVYEQPAEGTAFILVGNMHIQNCLNVLNDAEASTLVGRILRRRT